VKTGKSAVELQIAQGVLNAAKALVADVKARYIPARSFIARTCAPSTRA
jgi:hypothetical protein